MNGSCLINSNNISNLNNLSSLIYSINLLNLINNYKPYIIIINMDNKYICEKCCKEFNIILFSKLYYNMNIIDIAKSVANKLNIKIYRCVRLSLTKISNFNRYVKNLGINFSGYCLGPNTLLERIIIIGNLNE